MSVDGWIWTETALGVLQWADWIEPSPAGTAETEFGSWTGADEGAAAEGGGTSSPETLLSPDGDSFLSLDGDTFIFEGDEMPAAPAEAADDGSGPEAGAEETTALAGDLDVPDTGGDAMADVFPDWTEPSFDFLPADEEDGEPAADGAGTATPLAAAAATAPEGLEDFDGDLGAIPDEPEDTPPMGDFTEPADDDQPETFIADDGSVVTLAELTEPDLLL